MLFILPVLLGGLAVSVLILGFYPEKQKPILSLSFSLVLILQAFVCLRFPVFQPIHFNAPQTQSLWYQGGSLHKSTWAEWQKAPIQNRLATAADYLKTLREQGVFVARIRGLDEYRPWAAALVSCMEWEYAQQNGPQPEVVARECLNQNKIKRFFKP
jgi:hypothetical protein